MLKRLTRTIRALTFPLIQSECKVHHGAGQGGTLSGASSLLYTMQGGALVATHVRRTRGYECQTMQKILCRARQLSPASRKTKELSLSPRIELGAGAYCRIKIDS